MKVRIDRAEKYEYEFHEKGGYGRVIEVTEEQLALLRDAQEKAREAQILMATLMRADVSKQDILDDLS